MFQRMIAVPYEEYAQMSGSKVDQVKHPDDHQFHDLEKRYANQEQISDPYRRMMLQGETLDEMKQLKEKMRNIIASNSPRPYRSRANALFQGLESFLKFNDRGEILDDDGKVVSNSHIEDLIQYAVRDRRRNIVPVGWEQFTTLLKKHNVPRHTLNRLTLDEIDGKGKSFEFAGKDKGKTPFIFGSTPASRLSDDGKTVKQSDRWPITARSRKRQNSASDSTPQKSNELRRTKSDSQFTPTGKVSANPFNALKRKIADFESPPKKKARKYESRRRRRAHKAPIRFEDFVLS